jgi:hypothetical protein
VASRKEASMTKEDKINLVESILVLLIVMGIVLIARRF